MKLRRLVDDFRVREKSSLPIGSHGHFAAYELTKTGWTTLDALGHFSRTLNIPRKNMAHAGLKDRHAVTSQIVTIRNGPRRSWTEEKLALSYLGQAPRETTSANIVGNEFEIVLRSLTAEDQVAGEALIPQLKRSGIPNYFDDQRFGSWYEGEGFVGAAWVREDYEKALWLAFAEHHPDDDAVERRQKAILRDNWKDWITCKQLLDRSHRRSVVTFLCDKPQDFKGAWGIVNAELRGLYLSALQSDLWNGIASDLLAERCAPHQLFSVSLKTGPVNFPQNLTDAQLQELQKIQLPLPSARLQLDGEPLAEFMQKSLQSRGWSFPQLKVRFPRDRFFSRAQRPLLLSLPDLQGEYSDDEMEEGKKKLRLKFSLPRGSYATMLVKALTELSVES
ncbi:tRNA pseudouridine(13) synthase TruD [Planctomicrobium sp. SH661]|uniref:tRNA pseudouridine(13) synthase TruD n=1 Tax=Planctomicrobium sp. SH661 TaxID=3448124 RepID=UPI003F5B2703